VIKEIGKDYGKTFLFFGLDESLEKKCLSLAVKIEIILG
jgi:hypothetical protein